MNSGKKDRIAGIIATVITHLLLLFLFISTGMKEPDPPIKEEVMPLQVILGFTETGSGSPSLQEPGEQAVQEDVNETQSENASAQNIETQNETQTVSVNDAEQHADETETQPAEPEVSEHLRHLLNKFSSQNSTEGSQQGNTGGSGSQGSPDGNPNGAWEGGPTGTPWGSYALGGRGILSVPKINDTTQDEGKVVVDIVVDRRGIVLIATPGAKGSTTTSANLYKKAKEAALKAKFTPNPAAPAEQKGVMTFIFVLD